jgi:hypothetical protein
MVTKQALGYFYTKAQSLTLIFVSSRHKNPLQGFEENPGR